MFPQRLAEVTQPRTQGRHSFKNPKQHISVCVYSTACLELQIKVTADGLFSCLGLPPALPQPVPTESQYKYIFCRHAGLEVNRVPIMLFPRCDSHARSFSNLGSMMRESHSICSVPGTHPRPATCGCYGNSHYWPLPISSWRCYSQSMASTEASTIGSHLNDECSYHSANSEVKTKPWELQDRSHRLFLSHPGPLPTCHSCLTESAPWVVTELGRP